VILAAEGVAEALITVACIIQLVDTALNGKTIYWLSPINSS
jgi:hypothetical protein